MFPYSKHIPLSFLRFYFPLFSSYTLAVSSSFSHSNDAVFQSCVLGHPCLTYSFVASRPELAFTFIILVAFENSWFLNKQKILLGMLPFSRNSVCRISPSVYSPCTLAERSKTKLPQQMFFECLLMCQILLDCAKSNET